MGGRIGTLFKALREWHCYLSFITAELQENESGLSTSRNEKGQQIAQGCRCEYSEGLSPFLSLFVFSFCILLFNHSVAVISNFESFCVYRWFEIRSIHTYVRRKKRPSIATQN